MATEITENIRYVSVTWGDDTDRDGYVYTCPSCGWRSKVMRHRLGAEQQGGNHRCADKAST